MGFPMYPPPPAPGDTKNSGNPTNDLAALTGINPSDLSSPFNLSAGANAGSRVFLGWSGMGRTAETAGKYSTVGDLMKEAYGKWDRNKIASIGAKFVAAGWLQPGDEANFDKVSAAYQRVLEMAALMYKAGRYVTPDEVLNSYIGGASGGVSRPASYAETSKSVDLTNPKTARALLKQSLQDRLGRDPSAAEQQAFIAALNAAERENPTIRTSKYKLNPETQQYQMVSQTTAGGLDPSAYLDEYAEGHNQKEYGAYQAATTYFNALLQAIGAPVG